LGRKPTSSPKRQPGHATANGATVTATAKPITDPARVRDVVDKFRASYGPDQVAQYYPKTDVAVDVGLPE
jgi:hypothetical protein